MTLGKLQFKLEKNQYVWAYLQLLEDKPQVIKNIKVLENAAKLLTILGMINYLNRFLVNHAEYTATLRELAKKHEPHHQDRERTKFVQNHIIL